MTAAVSHRTPARFVLATADTWADPWPMYQALRDKDPVHHVVPEDRPHHDYWVLSRHADIWNAARDHETFSSAPRPPAVRQVAAERVERRRAAGGGAIVPPLSKPLPSMVVAHYLGVPEEDR